VRLVTLFLVALLPATALADIASGTPRFTWTLPTLNVDGTTIPATGPNSLKEVRIYCAATDAASLTTTTAKRATPVPALAWQSVAGDFPPGPYSCRATAVNNEATNNESARTNPVNFTVPTSAPRSVGSFGVD
jgi:hypothetical protein